MSYSCIFKLIVMNRFSTRLYIKEEYSILEKLEFWIPTAIYFIVIITIFNEAPTEEGSALGMYYLRDIFYISAFYFSFILMNFLVIPKILQKGAIWVNAVIIAAIIAVSILLFPSFDQNVLLLFLAGYFVLKFGLFFLWEKLRNFRDEKGSFYTGVLLAVVFYLIFMFLLFAGNAEAPETVLPGLLIPFAIFLHIYSYNKLIPVSLKKKRPYLRYMVKGFLVLLVGAIPLSILGFLLLQDDEVPFIINVINLFFSFVLTMPLTWFIYKRHMRGKEEVTTLKKELGQSTAKFDFLRSQINPHFLFNALNTLYGTALQEKAERTGEGIQQLGDMMRFMLHENMQEKISLARELEYLQNYINLQRLRTDPNPNMTIQAEIQEQEGYSQITPMLLIPFVENAFKHGISFREPSHIKIAFEKKGNKIYFDVYNSKHIKPENDPEKDKSGIGLTNVKDRLQLLYPGKHELLIRETSKEYFVHLTLELS